jgi:hypothetical protein
MISACDIPWLSLRQQKGQVIENLVDRCSIGGMGEEHLGVGGRRGQKDKERQKETETQRKRETQRENLKK